MYDRYWKFAYERHSIFERRVRGEPWPWTDDAILREFKFCNVYRAADRVSQYLIRNIACAPCGSEEDLLFQIVAFRLFSKPETWDTLCRLLGGPPSVQALQGGSFASALDETRRINGGLYTSAFILCANNAYSQPSKHLNHVQLLNHMFVRNGLAAALLRASSLRDVYSLLIAYPLMGEFMSYQVAVDLNYSELFSFSESEFTQPGPGALRGIKKAFEDVRGVSPSELVMLMVERQEDEFRRLGLPFKGLWGRRLQAIDCQGLFCELDKYCRVAVPELKSERRRIKARFSPSEQPIELLFPPKWGINAQLPNAAVLGSGCGQGRLF